MQITIPADLTDSQLLIELNRIAASEKQSTAQLVAHLAELDARQLHVKLGFSSLFTYGCEALHLSEHETYNRIEAARLARRFPVILELLGEGLVNLTTLRLLAPHLTVENHQELLSAASHKTKHQVQELVAAVAPRPDVPSSVRKLPVRREPSAPPPLLVAAEAAPPLPASIPRRAVVAPLAPDRYQMTFTVSKETRDKLRRLQDLLRHSIPTGDPAQIFDRALTVLLAEETRKKCSTTSKPRKSHGVAPHSRHIPAEVNRGAHARDDGSCAFVGKGGRRCGERAFIQRHHVKPYGALGEATLANIELRCRRHNQYEADLFYRPLREADERRELEPAVSYGPNSVRNEFRGG
jgi:hypothetical protein